MPASEFEITQVPEIITAMATNGESTTTHNSASEAAIAAEINGQSTQHKVLKTKFAVYCGASPGKRPEHLAMARELARAMHKHDIGLGIYIFFSAFNPCIFFFPTHDGTSIR